MKEAVDSQELKIQKSLINEDNSGNALSEITNRNHHNGNKSKVNKPIMEQM